MLVSTKTSFSLTPEATMMLVKGSNFQDGANEFGSNGMLVCLFVFVVFVFRDRVLLCHLGWSALEQP